MDGPVCKSPNNRWHNKPKGEKVEVTVKTPKGHGYITDNVDLLIHLFQCALL
jgi:hypothetical protein